MRQHISPYNSQNEQHTTIEYPRNCPSSSSNLSSVGPAQRRFKQFKERRKSLGIVLDDADSPEYDRIFQQYPEADLCYNNSSVSSSINSRRGSSNNHSLHIDSCTASICSSGNGSQRFNSSSLAIGNIEMDDCLIHHLERACHSLTAIDQCQNTPFEYTLTEMLIRMEAVRFYFD